MVVRLSQAKIILYQRYWYIKDILKLHQRYYDIPREVNMYQQQSDSNNVSVEKYISHP